jgi:ubiquinone/menaquinone biosynthesis C-methylase UbiE
MQLGDFTQLAKDYVNRAGYSKPLLTALARYVESAREGFRVADVGAGTGKLTMQLREMGLSGFAVEPNDSMRAEGMRLDQQPSPFTWLKGSAESTGLPDRSVNWVLMASSFHWPDQERALREFHRMLRPGGFFTALWNPRDLARSPLHERIEKRIYEIVPGIKRVSSGSSKYTQGIEETLLRSGQFGNLIFMDAAHDEAMSQERYLGAWRSVNDIQAQAGSEKFRAILQAIEKEIADLPEISVPYRTRAWTVQAQ